MNIVHIHLNGPYTDNWGYQENILPTVQARQGHSVTVIANNLMHLPNGTITFTDKKEYYINDVRIIRLENKIRTKSNRINNLLAYYPINHYLDEINPDIILLHGLGIGLTNYKIRSFIKKHNQCLLYGDVHSTYANMGITTKKNPISIMAKLFIENSKKSLFRYYTGILCLTPECIRFATEVYNAPVNKIVLFPLGFDPAICDISKKELLRDKLIKRNEWKTNDIVIVHGGKIIPRRNTDLAINAIKNLNNKRIHLIIFGEIDLSIRDSIIQLIDDNKELVTYLGHLSHDEYIDLLLSSDIGFFPGGESAIWQEAIGCGLPLILGKTGDIDYLNRNGNAVFVEKDNLYDAIKALNMVLEDDYYKKMKIIAETEGRQFFSYERISKLMLGEISE